MRIVINQIPTETSEEKQISDRRKKERRIRSKVNWVAYALGVAQLCPHGNSKFINPSRIVSGRDPERRDAS